jgi:hypothetical protein
MYHIEIYHVYLYLALHLKGFDFCLRYVLWIRERSQMMMINFLVLVIFIFLQVLVYFLVIFTNYLPILCFPLFHLIQFYSHFF